MGTRIDLQDKLEEILGSENVYFQPPATVRMKYPCIVYQREPDLIRRADNIGYNLKRRYSVVLIDRNPDTDIPDRLAELPYCIFDRIYTADNLNHYSFTLYF